MKPEHEKAIADYEWHLAQTETADRRAVIMVMHLEVARTSAARAFGEEGAAVLTKPVPVIEDPEGRIDLTKNKAFLNAHRNNIAALKNLAAR